jgi:hypothetical protein
MSRPEWIGLGVLGCGAVFGFLLGGAFGLALAGICLVVGLVLLVASEALGTKHKPADPQTPTPSNTHLIVQLKEVHARPQRAGKFQEITDPNQAGLQFEIFVHCWLVNDTDDRLGITAVRLTLAKPGGTPVLLECLSGNMQNWKLGRLRDELDSWGVRYLQAEQETMTELRTEEPLEGGSSRQGWLHVRAEGLTPNEIQNARLQLEVIDSHLASHVGELKGPHQIPGRVWPFRPEQASLRAASAASTSDVVGPSLGATSAVPSQ